MRSKFSKGFYQAFYGDFSRFCVCWADGEVFKLYDAEVPGDNAVLVGEYATKEDVFDAIRQLEEAG